MLDRHGMKELPHIPEGLDSHFEKEAVSYYESIGYEVTRIGRGHDLESKLRGKFPKPVHAQFFGKTPAMEELERLYQERLRQSPPGVLNGIQPDQFPLQAYPPDLFAMRSKHDWKFIEVKGPSDSMSFRQANWFINAAPKEWAYEIYASINRGMDEVLVLDFGDKRSTVKFEQQLERERLESKEYRAFSLADAFLRENKLADAVQHYEEYLKVKRLQGKRPNKYVLSRYETAILKLNT